MKNEETITTTETPKAGSATPKKTRAAKSAGKPETKKAAKPTAKKRVAKTEKSASQKAGPAAAKKEARGDTKKAIVLELLRRKQGATMAEIAKATDWQNHSIRGFISGHVTKKMGLTVESIKSDTGERTYRITK